MSEPEQLSTEKPDVLKRTLGLSDLLFFGITNILGSGAANLSGPTVMAARQYYPEVIAAVTGLLVGSSKTYAVAHEAYQTNDCESRIIADEIGGWAATGTQLGVVAYGILSIAVGLLFITRIFCSGASWAFQVMVAVQLAILLIVVGVLGIDINKEVVDFTSALFVFVLGAVGLIGLSMAVAGPAMQTVASVGNGELHIGKAFLYVFFILAGFDVIVKFTEETVAPLESVPTAMYGSNIISALLLVGVCVAFVALVPLRGRGGIDGGSYHNVLADIVDAWFGKGTGVNMDIFVGLFILISSFIQYIGVSRYIYSVIKGKDGAVVEWWRGLNARSAPHRIMVGVGALLIGAIFINNIDKLVASADLFLIVLLAAVGWSAARRVWSEGKRVPWVESGTTLGLLGVLGLAGRAVFEREHVHHHTWTGVRKGGWDGG
jgi:amino acid transporter